MIVALLLIAVLSSHAAASVRTISAVFGSNIPEAVSTRIQTLLASVPGVIFVTPSEADNILSCGNSSYSEELIPSSMLAGLGPEAFVIQTAYVGSDTFVVASNGNRDPLNDTFAVGRGAVYGCYAAMEQLGFAFLHPLSPTIPTALQWTGVQNMSTQPQWPVRGWHIHTQHPLELTDLLTGFDIVVNGTVVETWESMLEGWSLFLQWAAASRLNEVEWLLLWAKDWEDYALSPLRQQRFATLVDMCHNFTIRAGADAAIALQQQHAFPLINTTISEVEELNSINYRVNWIFDAGFDLISTESGFSEFTHPDDVAMLRWMNQTTAACTARGKKVQIKCHCSSDQYCKNYIDPRTGKPLNFNFLPIYADPQLGIMPHTVQYYSWDDPAPVYGSQNFTYMIDFMLDFANTRDTIYHPETTYWIDYDISVPLFLPIYSLGRVRDLRYIAQQQAARNVNVLGQIDFDSGWEWGYWLSDVVTARASWDPCLTCANDTAAVAYLLQDITRIFGPAQEEMTDVLVDLISAQHQLLVLGQLNNGSLPSNIIRRNGQGYLQGWDTFAELALISPEQSASVQPIRLGPEAAREPDANPSYWNEVRPLLMDMNETFSGLLQRLVAIAPLIPQNNNVTSLYNELVDSLTMLSLRASSVLGMYDFSASWYKPEYTKEWRDARLAISKSNIEEATVVVARRESQYRVPLIRIASWRQGPTVYNFTYLWEVHSLFFWWRDYAKATLYVPETVSPCFRNIQNPVDVAFGEGIFDNVTYAIWQYLEKYDPNYDWITDCLEPPPTEPHYDD